MKYSTSQKLMIADGFPKALFIPQDIRRQAWIDNPPKPYPGSYLDPKIIESRKLEAEFKVSQTAIRIARLKASQDRKNLDTTGMRWDARRNKWVPATEVHMPKIIITPYSSEGRPLAKATTLAASATADAILARMGAIYSKCSPGTCSRIEVTNDAGEIGQTWTQATDNPLPEPTPDELSAMVADEEKQKAIEMAKSAKKSTAKKPAAKKAAKGKAPKAAKAKKAAAPKAPKAPKGPGVIATIIETITRDKGASKQEILDVLVKKFPDREADSMIKTVMIQANKNSDSKEKDEKRGLVYYRKPRKSDAK